jgi:hypothetical protein
MPKNIRKPIVVVIRDADYANEYHTFGIVNTYDIDTGGMDLEDEAEAKEWAETHMYHALEYAYAGHPEVAELIEETVSNYVGDTIMREAVATAKEQIDKERA